MISTRCCTRRSVSGGQTELPTRHAIRLTGGEHARDVGLVVNDPKHQVARIIVELYPEGHRPGSGSKDAAVERVVIDDNSISCPPDCE